MKGDTVTVFVLLVTIIGIALWISHKSNIQPYSISKYAPYEGYQNINYSDSNSVKVVDDSLAQSTSDLPKCTQLGGWKGYGIFCTPNGGLNQIDIYSQAKGDLECGNSSGYHNSKGGLCLDKTMMNLLQTRGLNATGGNGQIGSGQA
jgi:hypothetical protein